MADAARANGDRALFEFVDNRLPSTVVLARLLGLSVLPMETGPGAFAHGIVST
jgi:hypothetical protein